MKKKKYTDTIPYFEQRIETPNGKSRLVIASMEFSSTDKKSVQRMKRTMQRAFEIPDL